MSDLVAGLGHNAGIIKHLLSGNLSQQKNSERIFDSR